MGDLVDAFKKGLDEMKDEAFWEGFDAAIEMVINTIKMGGFFEDGLAAQFSDELLEEVELYKKDQ